MAHFPKPAAGSWTENWPELGTAPVNYEDSIDPEHYKLEPQHVSFVAQGAACDPPTLVERSDQVLGRHPHVVEEDLVEVQVVLIACRREWAPDHTGKVGGDHQRTDALVFGGVWIGAHKSQQNVGVMGAGRPHLLPGDHEVVTVTDGTACSARPDRTRLPARSFPATLSSRPSGSAPPTDAVAPAFRTRSTKRR